MNPTMDLALKEIASVFGIRETQSSADGVPSGISTDSRTLKAGDLFFALSGDRFDGHDYVKAVLDRGACGAVVKEPWAVRADPSMAPFLWPVKDPLCALQDLAARYRKTFLIPVIAVTGSNGKTTTKEMVASILKIGHRIAKSEGNLNNAIGVSLSVCSWMWDDEFAVVEMGTNHFGEIRRLCEIVDPTHGVVTNVGKGHLEFFGDCEGVLRAKAELLDHLASRGRVFLNGDDPRLYSVRGRVKDTVLFGFSERCDVRARELENDPSGRPRMEFQGKTVTLPVFGRHQLSNALAAAAVCTAFGVDPGTVCRGLQDFRPVAQRMEIIHSAAGVVVINDSYNANPTSTREALLTLKRFPGKGRKIAILGDMLELGEASASEHEEIGNQVAEFGLDAFFAAGPWMEHAAQRARQRKVPHVVHGALGKDLISPLMDFLRDGDTVLVKGSRGMAMEVVADAIRKSKQHPDSQSGHGLRPDSP